MTEEKKLKQKNELFKVLFRLVHASSFEEAVDALKNVHDFISKCEKEAVEAAKEKEKSQEGIPGWVAWHPDPRWSSVIIYSMGESPDGAWSELRDFLESDDFSRCCGITEEMTTADYLEKFERAAVRAGWRIRPVKIIFTDEGGE